MSNTISQNPLLAKLLVDPDGKTGEAKKEGLSELVRADQALQNAKSPADYSKYDDQFSASERGRMTAARMEQLENAYQYSETMSLQLTTKEGDKVTLDFRQLYAEYQSYRQTQAAEEGPKGVRYFESKEAMEATAFEERFAFSVQGDLNEDELGAIFDVFEQVDELANNFFDGNIEKALEQAVNLKVDFNQLQGIKMDLTQSETMATRYQQSAVSEYAEVKEQGEGETPEEYGVSMSDLPPYLQKWQASIEKLDTYFENAQPAFDELMTDVVSERFPGQDSRPSWFERVQEFHARLAEYAAQQKELNAEMDQAAQEAKAEQKAADNVPEDVAETASGSTDEAAGLAVEEGDNSETTNR